MFGASGARGLEPVLSEGLYRRASSGGGRPRCGRGKWFLRPRKARAMEAYRSVIASPMVLLMGLVRYFQTVFRPVWISAIAVMPG